MLRWRYIRSLHSFLEDSEVCASHSVGSSAGCHLFLRKGLNYSSLAYTVDTEDRFITYYFHLQVVALPVICICAAYDLNIRYLFCVGLSSFLDSDKCVFLRGSLYCVCRPCYRSTSTHRRQGTSARPLPFQPLSRHL